MSGPDLNHVANMRVAQAKIWAGDTRWYVVTANGYIVRGPHPERAESERHLTEIRQFAYDEAREEAPED